MFVRNWNPWLRELTPLNPWRKSYAYANTIPGMAPSTERDGESPAKNRVNPSWKKISRATTFILFNFPWNVILLTHQCPKRFFSIRACVKVTLQAMLPIILFTSVCDATPPAASGWVVWIVGVAWIVGLPELLRGPKFLKVATSIHLKQTINKYLLFN